MISLDALDLALLAVLQRDGRATYQQPLEQVHLSASQVGRHLARFESEGVVKGYWVVLSPIGLGLGMTVFANVKLMRHDDAIVERSREEINLLGAVRECYSMVGDADYMLCVVVSDLLALLEFVMYKLMRVSGMDNTHSNIVLTTLKGDDASPLSHLDG